MSAAQQNWTTENTALQGQIRGYMTEAVANFRLAGAVVVTLEPGTCGLLCARSALGTLLAVGTWEEFSRFAARAKVSLVDAR